MFECGTVFYANLQATEKVIVNQGGTSSGKTYGIVQLLFKKAKEEAGVVITVAGQDIPNLKKGAYRDAETIYANSEELQTYIASWNKSERVIVFNNGSVIEFNSYGNAQDAKNGKRDYLFVNEANGISYDIYWQLAIRTRKNIYIDYNPTAPFWCHEEVIGKPNVKLIVSDHRHNPFLSQEEHDKIEGITDPELWGVYARGQTGNPRPESIWAYNFQKDKHVKECHFNIGQRLHLIWDFNLNPFVVLAAHQYRDEKSHHAHIFDELVLEPGDVYKMCQKVKDMFPQKAIDTLIVSGDFTSNKREIVDRENLSAWKIVARELNLSDSRIKVIPNPRGEGVKDNQTLTNALFARHPDFRISPNCKILIRELMSAEADENGRLLKKDRSKQEQRCDALDCLRYFTHTWLSDFLDNPKKYI